MTNALLFATLTLQPVQATSGLTRDSMFPESLGELFPPTSQVVFARVQPDSVEADRPLKREAQRNVELMWLTGRLTLDFKTIANFRKDNGKAIRNVCRHFVVLCRRLNLFSDAVIAIDAASS